MHHLYSPIPRANVVGLVIFWPERHLFFVGIVFGIDGERRDIAAVFRALGDPGHALFIHFINTYDGMHGDIGTRYIVEFSLQGFLGRVNDHGGLLPEDQLFDLDKTEEGTLAYVFRINLVNLALIVKYDLVNLLPGHRDYVP